jgi:hypothetical protein
MKVEFFDSLEEAQQRLRQAMEAADARVKMWQAAVKVGDCFIADGGEEGLLVFGEVLEGYQEPHLQHYRFCRCYSVACPEGELGDVHISTILNWICRECFERLRQRGWQMEAGQRPRSACRLMDGDMAAAVGSPGPAAAGTGLLSGPLEGIIGQVKVLRSYGGGPSHERANCD